MSFVEPFKVTEICMCLLRFYMEMLLRHRFSLLREAEHLHLVSIPVTVLGLLQENRFDIDD